MEFQRIGDSNYFYVQNRTGKEEDIFLDLSSSGLGEADARYLSLWISQQEKTPLSDIPTLLEYKGKLFRITAAEHSVAAHLGRVVSEATNFFRQTHIGQKKIYSVSREPLTIGQTHGLKKYIVEGAPTASITRPDIVTQEPIAVRISFQVYDDPYTNLAENAFQFGLEKFYVSHDTDRPSNTSFYFNTKSCELTLVRTQDVPKVKKDMPTAVRDAVNRYRYFLVTEYGEKKVQDMEHRLGINLTQMAVKNEPLTPELVYRFNMMTSQMRLPEVQTLWDELQKTAVNSNPDTNLIQALSSKIPIFQLRALVNVLKKDKDPAQLTIEDLKKWVDETHKTGKAIDCVMNLFVLDQVSLDRMYTGRKIFESITSDYTTADYGKRKPYVDAQELAQIAEEHFYDEASSIPESQKNAAFYERLAHVICKKELVHRDLESDLKVGLMIPARPDAQGNRQWYVVTACTRTIYGKCTYQLEPASKLSSLPRILLHRSTFTNEAPESLRNDVNPLSGPGYEGYGLSAPYEDDFVNTCTIPTWVGYAVWAQDGIDQKADPATIRLRLEKAQDALFHTLKKEHKPLTYHEFIQKYDFLLLDLLYAGMWTTKISLEDKKKLYEMISRYAKNDEGSPDQQKIDIDFIIALLKKFPSKQHDAFVAVLQDFAKTLEKNYKPLDLDAFISSKQLVQELKKLKTAAQNDDEKLNAWASTLIEYAKSIKEHPTHKQKQDIAIVGHSLGGALSQISMVRYTEKLERVPLATMQAWLFDAPGIHDADCNAFSAFGNAHGEMMRSIGSKLSIFTSQEQGDPVILAGQRHLGGTKSQKEETLQNQWLSFRGELFGVSQTAKLRALRDSSTAHATRFQERKSDSDVIIHNFSSTEQYAHDRAEQKSDWERFQQKWKLLPNIPTLKDLTKPQAEQLRKQLGVPLRAFRPWFLADQKENPFERHMDENGVFAITTSGILTKKNSL